MTSQITRTVSLTVHRNNRKQREAKRIRAMLKDDVKHLAAMPNIAGYAVVAWDAERGYRADWYTPHDGPMPGTAMPEYVKVSLLRDIVKADTRLIVGPFDDDGSA
jgi:hypothetical protein